MSTTARPTAPEEIEYPDSDGEPMAENTLQWEWIVAIKAGLDTVFLDNPDVFVASDLFWYPVEGDNTTRLAPDVMVAFGRPKGRRGSYMQWREEGIAPQVVVEVLSPGNRAGELVQVPVLRAFRGRGILYLQSRREQPGRVASGRRGPPENPRDERLGQSSAGSAVRAEG